jgi:hypothetical protein
MASLERCWYCAHGPPNALAMRPPGRVKWLGPPPESHNDEVYRGLLGLSPAEIEALRADAVI